MSKWADYLISAVRYMDSSKKDKIDKVKVYRDNGDKIDYDNIWDRSEVVSKLENNYTFYTIYKTKDNKWKKGSEVKIFVLDGEKYIRTDGNKKKHDNLEELPEF